MSKKDVLTLGEAFEQLKELDARPVRPITSRELANVLAALSLARRLHDEFPCSGYFDDELPLDEEALLEIQTAIDFGKIDFQNVVLTEYKSPSD